MRSVSFLVIVFSICASVTNLPAQVKLPYFFSDNMVLQQQTQANIWGWDKAGTAVSITTSWNKKKYTATTDAAGKWQLAVETPSWGGPYELTISDGKPITLHNVLIGEVWLCSGQSNMEMPMKGFKNQPILHSNEAILHSANKNIRLFTVPRNPRPLPVDTVKNTQWQEASPEPVSNFSATAYYFARLLNELLGIPVGLISTSYGGSPVEAFMSTEALKSFAGITLPVKNDTTKVNNKVATALFNGMIQPVIGYTIKGCIWYQGETNVDRPAQYEQLFPAMVKEWRERWGIGDFPFYYAQIAPFDYSTTGSSSNSAYLRDAQRKSLAQIPNSGMAVLMDIGEANSIHPRHKQEGGERLALLALAQTYHQKGFGAASPSYDSMSIEGNTINLHFANAKNGLTSYGLPLTQFEIAGSNKTFYPARAVITNNGISVSTPEIKQPVAVRYAFKDFIVGELYSVEGLPVSSFRTDNW